MGRARLGGGGGGGGAGRGGRRLQGLLPGQCSAASCGADHRRLFWVWTGLNSALRGAEPCGVGLVCRSPT